MILPPLVFVHGLWERESVWGTLAARYEEAGNPVRLVQLPFHDRPLSGPPPADLGRLGLQDYLATVREEIDASVAPPVLVGHSAGALLSLMAAVERPVRGLALLAPAAPPSAYRPSLTAARTFGSVLLQRRWWSVPVALDPSPARWGVFNHVPPADAAEALSNMVWESGRALFQVALSWLDGGCGASVDLSRVKAPTLILVGEDDRITPVPAARRIARRLKGRVDYREIPHAGHWLFHETALGQVVRHLDAFLGDLDPVEPEASRTGGDQVLLLPSSTPCNPADDTAAVPAPITAGNLPMFQQAVQGSESPEVDGTDEAGDLDSGGALKG